MNKERRRMRTIQRILDSNSGKYLLAYRIKDNKKIQRGLAIYKENQKDLAEADAERLVNDIDVVIKCWVEEK